MKKVLVGIGICLSLVLAISFKVKQSDVKKSSAEVNQLQGLYIFVDSKPVAEYEYLGTIKGSNISMSTQYQPVRDKLLNRLKKEYPNADGAILHFVNGGTDKADAIKFKE